MGDKTNLFGTKEERLEIKERKDDKQEFSLNELDIMVNYINNLLAKNSSNYKDNKITLRYLEQDKLLYKDDVNKAVAPLEMVNRSNKLIIGCRGRRVTYQRELNVRSNVKFSVDVLKGVSGVLGLFRGSNNDELHVHITIEN